MRSLESILSDVKPNTRLEELSAFCKTSSIVLYGAGLTGKKILRKLQERDVHPLFVVDDTPSKQGTELDGVSIVPLHRLETIETSYALIVTMLNPQMNFHSLQLSLQQKGIKNVYSFIELSFLFPGDLLPYFHFDVKDELLQDTNAIQRALSLFSDSASKEIFVKNLDFRLNLDFSIIPVGDKDEYFPPSIVEIPDKSIFFDCGAFDGDTIKSFVNRKQQFDAVYAFEPDPENFNSLLHYCSGANSKIAEKIYVFNYGLSSKHSFLKFNSLSNMASSIADEGNVIIQTIDLDSFFLPIVKDYLGNIFIKMDIEGEEPKALEGCRQLISQKQPHLAISIYHNPNDLWEIPLYIHSINPSYKFQLRQHGNDSMDLVLYAINQAKGI